MDLDRSKWHLIDQNLDRIVDVGFNSITLIVDYYVNDYKDPNIRPIYPGEPFPDTHWFRPTLTNEEIMDIALKAKKRGLSTILKMHIDTLDWPTGGKGRYALNPKGGNWDLLFKNYQKFAEKTAQTASTINAQVLIIGTETDTLVEQKHANRWKPIVAAVRSRYKGPISYASSFNAKAGFFAPSNGEYPKMCGACRVTIWNLVDYIGFEPYAGLTKNKDASLEELKVGVRRIIDKVIRPISKKYKKSVLIPEIAFESFDGVATNPISIGSNQYTKDSMPPDHEEQALAYQAWLETMNEDLYRDSLFRGIILWPGYIMEPSKDMQHWIHNDKGGKIWGKKAETTIKTVFADW